MKTVLINNYYTPYRDDLFTAIQKSANLAADEVDVVYVSRPEAKRCSIGWGESGTPHRPGIYQEDDPAVVLRGSGKRMSLPFSTALRLGRLSPDTLVCTLSRDMLLAQILCLVLARIKRVKLVYWIGDVEGGEAGGRVITLIDRLRLACARRADGTIYYSEKSRQWFSAFCPGEEPATVWIGGQVRHPLAGAVKALPQGRDKVRVSSAHHMVLRLLFVGGDDPRKGLDQLLSDLDTIAMAQTRTIELLVVGNEVQTRQRHGAIRVLSLGRLRQAGMRTAYQRSDVAIIASTREPWGFVFNEAVLAGCPCIVSERAGSSTVAARHGLAYRPGEPDTLARALVQAQAITPKMLADIASDLSVEKAAETFHHFLRALQAGERRVFRDY